MSQYAFPSPRSPYSTHQPIAYTTSSHSQHGHGGYNYGTPLKRASSVGHTYISSPQYGYPSVAQTPQTVQYLSVPSSHHRSRSHSRHSHHDSRPRASSHSHHDSRPRASSHSHHGHGHGYSTTTGYPVTYATSAPVYVQPSSGHHRSHSTSHRSHSRPSRSYASNGDYQRGRAPSIGDRVRQFFGREPSSNAYYGNQGYGHHNSYGGTRDVERRSRKHSGFVDHYGNEVDSHGRRIHHY